MTRAERLEMHCRRDHGRARPLVVVALALGVVVLGAVAAFAFWSYTDTSNGFKAAAAADSLPKGATPNTPTTNAPNGTTVTVTFSQVSTTTGHVAITSYALTRYPAAGGSGIATGSCGAPVSGTVTCTDTSVPSGLWQYTDTPKYSTNWIGIESNKSGTVTVDTTPPNVAISFPVTGHTYNAASWTTGAPIAGTSSDAESGVANVVVSVQKGNGASSCWTGTTNTFAAACPNYLSTGGTTANWTRAFTSANFNGDGAYTVSAKATDGATNTATTTATFTYDNTAPTVSITFPASGGVFYSASGWTAGAPIAGTATDAISGIAGASSIQVTITQSSTGKTWNGASFAAGTNTVPATTYNSGTGAFTFTFPNTNYAGDGTYTVSAAATDQAGNTGTSATNTFNYDTTPPVVSRPIVNGNP